MVKTTILVSGGGANLQAIIDAKLFGEIGNCEFISVISSHPGAYALTRAQNAGLQAAVIDINTFPTRRTWNKALLQRLTDLDTQLVVLAGFLYPLDSSIVKKFKNRIITVHPSLIPAFFAEGCYETDVHKMALQYGVKVTGATVHFVAENADAVPIILQKAIEVRPDDTPKALQQRVMEECEWELLPRAVDLFCRGKLHVDGNIVHIDSEPTETEGK